MPDRPLERIIALAVAGAAAVATVEAIRVRLPLRQVHRAAHGSEHVRDVVLVSVGDAAGRRGWGECPTLSGGGYSAEDPEGAWTTLTTDLIPGLFEGRCGDRLATGHPIDPSSPMASAAVEAAVVDLALRREGVSLAVVLGATRPTVPRAMVLSGLDSARGAVGGEELVAAVDVAIAGGARLVKFKVSGETDLTPLAVLRRERPDVAIAVDANGSLGDAPEIVSGLARLGLAYVEQPLPPHDPDAGAIRAELGVPVALDEAVASAVDLARALQAGAGDVVNIKPARLGGLAAALRCVEVARDRDAGVFVGGMLETGVGRAAAIALAAGIASAGTDDEIPCDLGPSSQYFDDDITEPLGVDHRGDLIVPTGDGIGIDPRPGRLGAVTVDRFEVTG